MGNRIVKFVQKYSKFGIILTALLAVGGIIYGIWGRQASAEGTTSAADVMVFRLAEDSAASVSLARSVFPGTLKDYESYLELVKTAGLAWPTDQAWWRVTDLGGGDYSLSVAFPLRKREALAALNPKTEQKALFKGINIYQLELDDGREAAFAHYRGLLILGRLPLQVEAAITALQNGKQNLAPDLSSAEAYLKLDNLLLASEWPFQLHLKTEIRRWQSGFSGLQWRSSGPKDSLLLSGKLMGVRAEFDSLTAPEDSWSYLPAQADWCHFWPLPSIEEGATAYHHYLQKVAGRHALSVAMPGKQRPLYLLQLRDEEQAEAQLEQLANELGELQQYDYQLFTVRQVLSDDLFEPLGIDVKNPHLSILGDYLLIGSRKAVIQQLLASVLANQTLSQQVGFLKLWSQIEQGELAGWYFEQQKQWVNASPDSSFLNHHRLLMKINGKGFVKGAYLENREERLMQEASLLWAAPLLAEARSGVQCVSDGAKESFLLQDTENRLYRFDEEGQLIFKRLLDGAIIGAVQVVDYFRTGRSCFSFSTPSRIYLLDDKGEDIGAFPLQLVHRITTPVLAANLKGEQRYAFFVADTTGSIRAFDQSGSSLSAWDEVKLDSTLHHSLRHVQRAGEDYFLALTNAGTLYALDKVARMQFDSVRTAAQFRSPIYYQDAGPAGRVALADVGGIAHIINLKGDYFRLNIGSGAKRRGGFLFLNMAGDDRKDYLAYDKQGLSLHYYRNNDFLQLWDKKVNISIDTAFNLSRQAYDWVGILDKEEQRISVVLPDGSLHLATPLAGTTPFCLSSEEAGFCKLVAGNGNRLYAYRIMDLQ